MVVIGRGKDGIFNKTNTQNVPLIGNRIKQSLSLNKTEGKQPVKYIYWQQGLEGVQPLQLTISAKSNHMGGLSLR